MTKYFRIEKITLKPLTILARDHEDAIEILGHSFAKGFGHRPDADFEVVEWRPRIRSPRSPPIRWIAMGHRGIAWPTDEVGFWKMTDTDLPAP